MSEFTNVYSIATKKLVEEGDIYAYRQLFPRALVGEIEGILRYAEYSLYMLAVNGFDISKSIMIVPLGTPEGVRMSTVAVLNGDGDHDLAEQWQVVKAAHRILKKDDRIKAMQAEQGKVEANDENAEQ